MSRSLLARRMPVILVVCAAAGAAFGEDPSALKPDDAKLLETVRGIAGPWHEIKPEWVAKATVVVVGPGGRVRGPCIFDGEGNSMMPALQTVQPEKVLRGEVRCPRVILRYGTSTGLPYFVEGRNYLVFLAPSEKDRKNLADPKGFGAVGPDGAVVAMIDLSALPSEAQVRAAKPVKSGEAAGVTFTPEQWIALREAKAASDADTARMIDALEKVVLVEGRRLLDITDYLGRPDAQRGPDDATWYLNTAVSRRFEDGAVHTELRVEIHRDGTMARYSIETLKCEKKSERFYFSSRLKDEELAKRGLRNAEKSFPPREKPKPK